MKTLIPNKTFRGNGSLFLNGKEFSEIELSTDAERCLYFTRRNEMVELAQDIMVLLDFRLEQIGDERYHFSGYMEIPGAIPGEELYRYMEGEFHLQEVY